MCNKEISIEQKNKESYYIYDSCHSLVQSEDLHTMRKHTITLRLSDEERLKLEHDSSSVQMTTSQYIRAIILQNTPKQNSHQREIAAQLCKLYIMLKEKGVDPDESLMEEMNRLCQILY